jgi:hypothetical protein
MINEFTRYEILGNSAIVGFVGAQCSILYMAFNLVDLFSRYGTLKSEGKQIPYYYHPRAERPSTTLKRNTMQ